MTNLIILTNYILLTPDGSNVVVWPSYVKGTDSATFMSGFWFVIGVGLAGLLVKLFFQVGKSSGGSVES